VVIIKLDADLPSSHYCSADARMRASAKKQNKKIKKEYRKEFVEMHEKSLTKLKLQQKSWHFINIKRQAIQGLEGILREGRGHWPISANLILDV